MCKNPANQNTDVKVYPEWIEYTGGFASFLGGAPAAGCWCKDVVIYRTPIWWNGSPRGPSEIIN